MQSVSYRWMEALDLTTPAGRAMAGLLTMFTEFEREGTAPLGRGKLVLAEEASGECRMKSIDCEHEDTRGCNQSGTGIPG